MKVLIADDETPKVSNIRDFLRQAFPQFEVMITRSVRSTIATLCNAPPSAMLLDMSLPTFDIGPGEAGGRPQGFGGIEVLRHMDFHRIRLPVIVVTQYEAFTENGQHIDLTSLATRLSKEHPYSFRGCVYYGPLVDSWQKSLSAHISRITEEIAK